jgi:hypothetical protein
MIRVSSLEQMKQNFSFLNRLAEGRAALGDPITVDAWMTCAAAQHTPRRVLPSSCHRFFLKLSIEE